MFYKTCLTLAVAIVILSLIGSFANASSLTLRQQNYVDSRAQNRVRSSVYILPNPFYSRGVYTGGSGSSRNTGSSGSGSSRSSYDGYRGGGPGSGK